MTDDRDVFDEQLLGEGRYPELVATYYPLILDWLRMRVKSGAAYDVAHDATVRILGELRRGKRYATPFRVAYFQVAKYALLDHYQAAKVNPEVAWTIEDEDWRAYGAGVDGGFAKVEFDDWTRDLFVVLTLADREVAELHFIQDVPIAVIAERLGKSRNAVDQAIHRVRRAVREAIGDG